VRGDPEIISLLNEQLTSELTAINQYFLHAKMQQNWGFTKLAAYTRGESILEGLPNYQRLGTLRIGQTVREQMESDLAIELAVVERLRPGIIMCREKGDATTANLFEEILADEEHHIDYIETNLELMDTLGDQLYLAQLVDQPPTPG
jgi:bacterioferritin